MSIKFFVVQYFTGGYGRGVRKDEMIREEEERSAR